MGSQGMGVASNSWFDRALLLIVYTLKPSCWPMLEPPSLGPPEFPLKLSSATGADGLCREQTRAASIV